MLSETTVLQSSIATSADTNFSHAAWFWRLAALGWAAAMAWGCLQEAGGAAPGWWRLPHIDKLAHAGMHGLLAWLLWRGAGRAAARSGLAIVALCAGYGLAIEWAQWQFTVTRSAEILDALANTLGAALGLMPGRWQTRVDRSAAAR